nr:uncharacterized protein LOC123765650 [Procambarus clarkii]
MRGAQVMVVGTVGLLLRWLPVCACLSLNQHSRISSHDCRGIAAILNKMEKVTDNDCHQSLSNSPRSIIILINNRTCDDTMDKTFGQWPPVPVQGCVRKLPACRHSPHVCGVPGNVSFVSVSCVSDTGTWIAALVPCDESSCCVCLLPSSYDGSKSVSDALKESNTTLPEDCPQTRADAEGNSNQTTANDPYSSKIHANDSYRRKIHTTNHTVTSVYKVCTVYDTGTCSGQLDMWYLWEVTLDTIICLSIMGFIIFTIYTIWKKIIKDNFQTSQQESIELDSEETLIDIHEVSP